MAAKRTTACLDNDNCDDKYNADDDNIDYFDDDWWKLWWKTGVCGGDKPDNSWFCRG